MNTPPLPPLPESAEQEMERTFDAPSILFAAELDAQGLLTTHVRHGKSMQLESWLTETRTDTAPPDESEQVFRIRALNAVNVGNAVANVINDAIDLGDLKLQATRPSASEYRALIGREVMIYSRTEPSSPQATANAGRPHFVTRRVYITLP